VSRTQVASIAVRSTPVPTPLAPVPTPRPITTTFPAKKSALEGRAGASAAFHSAIPVRHAALRSAASRPVWDVAAGGTAVRAPTAGGGTSGGAGSGTQGAGNGAASGTPPCGYVTFSDPHGSHFDSRTHGFYVDIRMSVHFADGSAQSMLLDYPWYYPSEAANPWSDRNVRDPNFPTRFQSPPTEKLAGEPELVRYVMEHSTSDGSTLLGDCPAAPATPAARRRFVENLSDHRASGLAAIGHSPYAPLILVVNEVPLG
jgi:hypothetical protein